MERLNLIVFLVVTGVTLPAYLTLVGVVFPAATARSQAAWNTSRWQSFLLGLVNLLFFLVVAILFFNLAQNDLSGVPALLAALIALGILLALAILTSIGLAGFARVAAEQSEGKTMLRAAFLLTLACITPFVGWFIFTPFAVAAGLGAAIQSMIRRKAAPVG